MLPLSYLNLFLITFIDKVSCKKNHAEFRYEIIYFRCSESFRILRLSQSTFELLFIRKNSDAIFSQVPVAYECLTYDTFVYRLGST